ncbi:MAG: hypothetical protein R2882_08630 [Gemmatimonadales bacterium]
MALPRGGAGRGPAATGTLYLSTILRWEEEQTVGIRYYGLSRADRAAFRNRLRKHARLAFGR